MSTLEQLKEKNRALEQRVEKLEQRFENPPVSRRAAIAGGAGILGLSALSGSASAGSNQVGTIGSSSDRVDIFADDIDANQLIGVSTVGDNYLYAGEFSGGNPDTRLDNCLNAATKGTTIYLENATYTNDRSIGTEVTIMGTAPSFSQGTFLDSVVWTINKPTKIMHVGVGGSGNVTFDVFADGCIISHIIQNTLTANFGSNTSGGIVNMIATDKANTGASATINDPSGNNIIGNEIV